MITVFHGEDVVTSRNSFLAEKQKYPNSQIHDVKKLSKEDLLAIFQAKNLFFEQNTIFIENLFSAKNVNLLNLLKNASKNLDIFIWESKELSKTDISQFKDASIKLFKLPQNLFSFLDSIRPNNPQNVLLFHKALSNSPEDLVFYMLIRQFRLLLVLRSEIPLRGTASSSQIDEIKRLAPWQRSKLERQTRLFSMNELKRIYKKLYEIDLAIKTGEAQSLTSSIDFLLLDI